MTLLAEPETRQGEESVVRSPWSVAKATNSAATDYGPRTTDSAGRSGWWFAAFLLAAGLLIFAHGCHGDEDNELFTAIATLVTR
jgi:hypothetical protein